MHSRQHFRLLKTTIEICTTTSHTHMMRGRLLRPHYIIIILHRSLLHLQRFEYLFCSLAEYPLYNSWLHIFTSRMSDTLKNGGLMGSRQADLRIVYNCFGIAYFMRECFSYFDFGTRGILGCISFIRVELFFFSYTTILLRSLIASFLLCSKSRLLFKIWVFFSLLNFGWSQDNFF
jgi:hypothetical protein